MAGSGTKRERSPGVWELRVQAGKDPTTGRYRQISRTFHGGARAADRELSALAARYAPLRGPSVTFRAHTEEWLAGARLSPTTMARYTSLLRVHIYPAVGDRRLVKITAWDLDSLYARMTRGGQAPASVRQAHSIIRRSLGQAVKWDRVDANVAAKATPPPQGGELRPIPETEAVRLVLEEAARLDERLASLIWVAAATGARRGELCGLQWRHVDFAGGEVAIKQAVVGVKGGVLVKDTKTHQERNLSIDPATVGVLRLRRARAEELARAFGATLTPDAFVFSAGPDGSTPPHPDALTWAFTKVRRAAGVEYFTLHGLRHWMVTTALVEGGDVRTVAGRAGHKDSSVTLRVYAHFLAAADQGIAVKIGRHLAGASGNGGRPYLKAEEPAGPTAGTADELTG